MQKYLLAPVTPVGDNGMGVEYVAILPFDDSGTTADHYMALASMMHPEMVSVAVRENGMQIVNPSDSEYIPEYADSIFAQVLDGGYPVITDLDFSPATMAAWGDCVVSDSLCTSVVIFYDDQTCGYIHVVMEHDSGYFESDLFSFDLLRN